MIIDAHTHFLDCSDQVMGVSHQPEHLRRRSEGALEIIQTLSQYKREEAEQNAALAALLSRSPPLREPMYW